MARKILLPLLFLTLALLLFGSCGSPEIEPISDQVSPTDTRTPLPPPIFPEFPTGKYFHQHEDGTYCVWVFKEDGTDDYFYNTKTTDVSNLRPYVKGSFTVDGSLYTETSDSYCSTPATYNWTFDGHNLTFQVVGEDQCADRQRTFETPLMYTKAE